MFLAHSWPDAFDATVTAVFLAVIVVAPSAGYFFLIADFRAYLRSLRGVLVIAVNYFAELPAWASETTPRSVAKFGLTLPCDEADLLSAYRAKVKELHPDRGGDRRKFLRLQKEFEEALAFLREREARQRGEAVAAS